MSANADEGPRARSKPAASVTPYSSLVACLAHYRALRANPGASAADRQRLAEISDAMAELSAAERAILENEDSSAESGAIARRRARAESRLAEALRERGVLAG